MDPSIKSLGHENPTPSTPPRRSSGRRERDSREARAFREELEQRAQCRPPSRKETATTSRTTEPAAPEETGLKIDLVG